jgi:LPXTG-motif cell wall-anchored protein
LAAAAIGFDTERGDQLIVESLPFETTLNLESPEATPTSVPPPAPSPDLVETIKKNWMIVAGAAAAVLVLLGAGAFLFIRKRKKSASVRVEKSSEAITAASSSSSGDPEDSTYLGSQSAGANAALAMLAPPRADILATQVREIVANDAEVCVGVLRGWLREGHS